MVVAACIVGVIHACTKMQVLRKEIQTGSSMKQVLVEVGCNGDSSIGPVGFIKVELFSFKATHQPKGKIGKWRHLYIDIATKSKIRLGTKPQCFGIKVGIESKMIFI